MLIVRNPKAMGELTLPRLPTVLGWTATAVMTLATALFFASLI
jgi:Mn2+/Fe2+ NRAMP family transporter